MKSLVLACLLSICTQAHAEVLIYRFSNTITTNGQSATTVKKRHGYLVLDNDHSTVVTVTIRTDVKRFFVTNEGMFVEKIDGWQQSFTTFARYEGYRFDLGKGKNSKVKINGKTLSVPRVFSTIGRTFLMESAYGVGLQESTGSAVLDTKQTALYDAVGYNLDRVLSALRNLLDSQGYLEDDSIR